MLTDIFSPFAADTLCGVASLAETFPSFPVSGPFIHDVPGFQVPSDSVFSAELRPSSRALPPHLHFHNFSDVFSFIYCFNEPEPFQPSPSHDPRYRFHPCFLQDLISTVFQQAHPIAHHTILTDVNRYIDYCHLYYLYYYRRRMQMSIHKYVLF